MATLSMSSPQGNAAPLVAEEGVQPLPAFGEDGEEVSEEEQAEYNAFVEAASDLIHGGDREEVLPEVLQSLGRTDAPAPEPDPEEQGGMEPPAPPAATNGPIIALANTAVQICQKLDVDSAEAGKPWSDEVLYQGAAEVIEMLAEIAEAANIYTYSEQELEGAFYQAVDLYRPIAIEMGRTTEETLKGQFAEIDEADKAGRLGDILPGAGAQTIGQPPVGPVAEEE